MDQQLINRIVEAALLASSQPLTVVQLNGLFPLDEPAPEGSLQAALETLQAEAAGRGIELVEVASGWRYQVQADVHPWVARLWTERQTKYTRATLETLALIAYRQPITRGEIEQVRGVATNSNIIKALEEREWIRVVGHRDMPGRPELLGTTKGFLDYFGLKRLDELPPLSELKDFGELEPQFEFDGPRAVGGIAAGGDDDGDAGSESQAANDAAEDDPDDDRVPAADQVDPLEPAAHDEDRDGQDESGDDAPDEAAFDEDPAGETPAAETSDPHAPDSDDGVDEDLQREVEAETDTHDTVRESAADPDALADDGDSTGARHD
ncbi:SMC-Scp complex subunit ScpB [Luteimonas viscosa]|uniref:SMC-Scp complex subunit ScpB n=1 Tax=Luteimonas viscosa TaxID=1132694 RepID=A0A5D4XLB4_9GAMM|nr:SMC-Scp complex subunit ScpB [Luteimonas viscosa]TYT23662.1 SMC-Scp complex subunit ScpB [Luteimonas viscosa]